MSRVLKTGENKITNSYEKHKGWSKGVDVVKSIGHIDDIIAHTTGKVIKVIDYMTGTNLQNDKEGMGYGCYVMILHDDKYQGKFVVTLYAHLASVDANVYEGMRINKGETFGVMGDTGNSYGPHLHFEVRLFGEVPNATNLHDTSKFVWIDPTPYLDADLPKDEVAPVQFERVQIGAFGIFENAVRRAKEVINKGYKAIIKKYNDIYRVQVGAYASHINAVNMRDKMQSLGYEDAYITTEGGADMAFK